MYLHNLPARYTVLAYRIEIRFGRSIAKNEFEISSRCERNYLTGRYNIDQFEEYDCLHNYPYHSINRIEF